MTNTVPVLIVTIYLKLQPHRFIVPLQMCSIDGGARYSMQSYGFCWYIGTHIILCPLKLGIIPGNRVKS